MIATETMEPKKAALLHYVVDSRASRLTVQAFATGVLSAMGHNPRIGIRMFRGEVDFNPEAAEAPGFRLSIETNSFSVLDDISNRDRGEIEKLMNEQVLDVAKYPEIVYEASAISATRLEPAMFLAAINGTLSFRGVTRNQPVSARISVFDAMLRASGEFSLRQSDYGIKPISVAAGALKVKDELKFSFEMVAREQG